MYDGPLDHLRYGFRSLESEMASAHPVSVFQKNRGEAEWLCKMDMVRRSYGSHMAMRLASEKAMLSRPHRLPGLQSSNISLETVMGTDTTIDFTDYLNGERISEALNLLSRPQEVLMFNVLFASLLVPGTRTETPKIQLHSVMEVKLGMM